MTETGSAPEEIDVTVPNVARMYDYYLGGKDNYASDREAAEKVLQIAPFAPLLARQNRGFMTRAVSYIAGLGIHQFLDVGTGLPTQGSVHQVAGGIDPGARVAYVDNDPVVVAHGRALLGVDAQTVVVRHDLRRPAEIVDDPAVRTLIDFSEPVGLLLVSVLHCLDAADHPYKAVAELRDALAPGSHLVISHITGDDDITRDSQTIYNQASTGMNHRNKAEIIDFFDGFELVEPGVVRLDEWRPDGDTDPTGRGYYYCGVGRK